MKLGVQVLFRLPVVQAWTFWLILGVVLGILDSNLKAVLGDDSRPDQVPVEDGYVEIDSECLNSGVSLCERDHVITSSRVVVVGDVHGDLSQLVRALHVGGVVADIGKDLNHTLKWIGGDTTLVQTGDILDRGPFSAKAYQLLFSLREEAILAGGCVILIMGNHELMNLAGDFSYADETETEMFGGLSARVDAMGADHVFGQKLRNLPIIAKIEQRLTNNNITSVAAHAGIEPWLAEKMRLDAINGLIYSSFPEADQDRIRKMSYSVNVLGSRGVVWTRMFGDRKTKRLCQNVAKSLKLLEADMMIVGHTPQMSGRPELRCNGTLLLADSGMSSYYGGGLSVTTIESDGGVSMWHPSREMLLQYS